MEINMKIGGKIKNAREDMDMSQSDVARLIPMNQSNYSKIERDLQEPSIEQLRRICQILNLDPSFLLDLGKYQQLDKNDLDLLADMKVIIEKYKN